MGARPARESAPAPLELRETSIEELGSQGLFRSPDGSAVMLHRSTVCPQYYRAASRTAPLNADRGGFGLAPDGTTFGCVFDGATSGGKINVYAAQAFTSLVLRRLATEGATLRRAMLEGAPEGSCQTRFAEQLFRDAASWENNPGRQRPEHDAECGAATGAFVLFLHERDSVVMATGAAIGDAAVFVIDHARCTAAQLNQVSRIGNDARDTGGQLDMCIGINGTVSGFSARLHAADSTVILCTDGLTDNLGDRPEAVLPWVVGCGALDAPLPGDGPECAKLPSDAAGLEALLAGTGCKAHAAAPLEQPDTSPEQVATRLHNFVEWVTRRKRSSEAEFYELAILRDEHLRRLSEVQSVLRGGVSNRSDEQRHALEEEQAQLAQKIEQVSSDIKEKLSTKPDLPGKTDDLALIALRPLRDSAWF